MAVIEGCLIIMHRMSLVAQIFHIKGHTLAGRFLQDRLVRIFTRTEKSRFMALIHSNSVLAVPAPTDGTLKYPDGKFRSRK